MNLREALFFSKQREATHLKEVKRDNKRTYTIQVALTTDIEPGDVQETFRVTIKHKQREQVRLFSSFKDCCAYLDEWGVYGIESELWSTT
jgi:hypothetical protein